MTARVLVTRAEPGAARTCKRLEALGYDPVDAATARIVPFDPELRLVPGEAVAVTSPNGAAAAARLTDLRSGPVFTVGDASAAAARDHGFTRVTSAGGDGAALAALITAEGPDGVVHVRGRDQQFNLVAALTQAGVPARSVIAYAAEPVDALRPETIAALKAGAAVLIHSPRGAERFCALARQAGALTALRGAPFAAISEAAAEPLRTAGASRIAVAETPDEAALMTALERALR